MHVGVDESRKHVFAGSVDDVRVAGSQCAMAVIVSPSILMSAT